MTGRIVHVSGRGDTIRDSLQEVSYDECIMRRGCTQRRGVFELCMVLAGMLLAWGPGAYALDPSLDANQYAHTSWKIRQGSGYSICASACTNWAGPLSSRANQRAEPRRKRKFRFDPRRKFTADSGIRSIPGLNWS